MSAKISQIPRALNGQTDIGGAINYSASKINNNGFEGTRRVIDVSGDGAGDSIRAQTARDAAIQQGITINALLIRNEDPIIGQLAQIDIEDHYQNDVIGGDGAFIIIADDFQDFQVAIRRKLVREITGSLAAQLDTVQIKNTN